MTDGPVRHPLVGEPVPAPPSALACRFCHRTGLWVWDKGVPGGFAICCSHPFCAATGPISMVSVEDAARLWNLAYD